MDYDTSYEFYQKYFKENIIRMSDEEIDRTLIYIERRILDLQLEQTDFLREKQRRHQKILTKKIY